MQAMTQMAPDLLQPLAAKLDTCGVSLVFHFNAFQDIHQGMDTSPHQAVLTPLALLPAIQLNVLYVISTQGTYLFLGQKYVYFAPLLQDQQELLFLMAVFAHQEVSGILLHSHVTLSHALLVLSITL